MLAAFDAAGCDLLLDVHGDSGWSFAAIEGPGWSPSGLPTRSMGTVLLWQVSMGLGGWRGRGVQVAASGAAAGCVLGQLEVRAARHTEDGV